MEEQIKNLETKIDSIQVDIKKMKSYFAWTFWVTIALFILPLIGLLIAVPKFLNSYGNLDNIDSAQNINTDSLNDLLNQIK